jgi:hypothetical protein
MTDKRGRPQSDFGKLQAEQAEVLGVSLGTIQRWEIDRQDIFDNGANSDLVKMSDTPEGYKKAIKEARRRANATGMGTNNAPKETEYLSIVSDIMHKLSELGMRDVTQRSMAEVVLRDLLNGDVE